MSASDLHQQFYHVHEHCFEAAEPILQVDCFRAWRDLYFQVFLTVGGGTKFIPMTGVTLPFISYGGSSVLTTLVMFFIIEGLYIIRRDEGDRRAKNRKRKSSREKRERRAGVEPQDGEDEEEA